MATSPSFPEIVPAMTLRDTVFFPQTILPLYIFEPRYRRMLCDVLAGNRLFAVVRLDAEREAAGEEEPCYPVATIGVVRASQANPDGTSNLVLQGLSRVRIEAIVEEHPYRRLRISPLTSAIEAAGDYDAKRRQILALLQRGAHDAGQGESEFVEHLQAIDDPDAFLDLTIHSACPCPDMRQKLLETLPLHERYERYLRFLQQKIEQHYFLQKLQQGLADERIPLN